MCSSDVGSRGLSLCLYPTSVVNCPALPWSVPARERTLSLSPVSHELTVTQPRNSVRPRRSHEFTMTLRRPVQYRYTHVSLSIGAGRQPIRDLDSELQGLYDSRRVSDESRANLVRSTAKKIY